VSCLQALRAFKLAGLVDDMGKWTGGDTVCVQVGPWGVSASGLIWRLQCI